MNPTETLAPRTLSKQELAFGLLALLITLALFSDVIQQEVLGWLHPNEDNIHSLISLVLLGILVWKAPHHLAKPMEADSPRIQRFLGLGLVMAGAVTLYIARDLEIVFLQQAAFWVTLWGLLALYRHKRPTGYGFLLSLFLVQAIPWLIIIPITFPLKLWATHLSAGAAILLGWPVTYTQNLIQINGLDFQVTSPCSGLNSIVGLTFVWLLAALINSLRLAKVLLILPVVWGVAILLNALRLFLTIGWGLWINRDSAFIAHDVLGYLTFCLGMVILLWISQKVAAR